MKLSLAGNNKAKSGSISLLSSSAKGKQSARSEAGAGIAKTKKTVSAFGTEDGERDHDPPIEQSHAAGTSLTKQKGADPTRPGVSGNASRLLKKLHTEAQSIDPSIFAYDEVYDSMKAGAQAAEEERKNAKEVDKPKYVSSLLKAAEVRKNDRIRAEDKLIEREREKEGDEFQGKEAFVTTAYKEQQEELRRAEEEERRREEREAKRPGGMAAYYEKELARSEAIHAAAVAASSSASTALEDNVPMNSKILLTTEASELAAHGPKSEAAIAAEASAVLGRTIQLNVEGQIIDKRELLSGGLNVKPRRVLGPASGPPKGFALSIAERKLASEEVARAEQERKDREDTASLGMTGLTMAERQRISRERQSRELERQMLESNERKRKAEEEKERETVKRIAKRNNDESKVEGLKRKAAERRAAARAELEAKTVDVAAPP